MTGWLITKLTVEGLRGINNEGDPLVLDFKTDAVSSVFAPNAVGKSSIYDALSFCIRGSIKKLDELPAAEKGRDYYKNRFHSTGLADNALRAIQDAIALHDAAKSLKMTAAQRASFATNGVAAVGNFLAHYATGITSTFTTAALNQVLKAIEDLGRCFQTEDPPGSGNWNYFKALDKIS